MDTTVFILLNLMLLAPAKPPELPLPTCYIPLTEIATTARGALVATLLSVDSWEFGSPGTIIFEAHWKVIQTLRGNYPQEVRLDFSVKKSPEKHREQEPIVGQTYILISYDISQNQIAYVFDYSEANQRWVEQFLSGKR